MRVGSWRIVYTIDAAGKVVVIMVIGHRGQV